MGQAALAPAAMGRVFPAMAATGPAARQKQDTFRKNFAFAKDQKSVFVPTQPFSYGSTVYYLKHFKYDDDGAGTSLSSGSTKFNQLIILILILLLKFVVRMRVS
jgi:hypothetical protein